MAKTGSVWGIDIGQCAIKAMRCRPDENDPSKIVAEAFDYIEYPKILSQPEADPVALVQEALELFLSRNSVKGDKVAIAVGGQNGLARFIKLPPVESKKVPDIVRYEAKQQIPFSLEDVVWDYQQMAGGSEEEGFTLETEVGLFAMKKDQVDRALAPFEAVDVEVDVIQLAPLSIFNSVVFDRLQDIPPVEEYDPEDPPPSIVVLSLGTENTDLVITNGYRVWQRSIPLGGNHFTKAVSKELKLTFAKAEHLKRNATQAEDPKAIFQAMRPVFNDMLTELQRSLGYFNSLDRKAKIGKIIAMGNAMKLPGLQRYLSQHLEHEVVPLDSLEKLSGPQIKTSPVFRDNLLSFAVSYGLCVQALDKSYLKTNLLPIAIVNERLVREKKPWAVAALAALAIGCTVSFLGHWRAWSSAHSDRYAGAFTAVGDVKRESDRLDRDYTERKNTLEALKTSGRNLVSNIEERYLWPELLKAIDEALPQNDLGPEENRPPIGEREELHIVTLECQPSEELSSWFAGVQGNYQDTLRFEESGVVEEVAPAGDEADPDASDLAEPVDDYATDPALAADDPGPTGPGMVIELRGYHYHNEDQRNFGETYLRRTLIDGLLNGTVDLPVTGVTTMKELGIGYPVVIEARRLRTVELVNPNLVDEEVLAEGSDDEEGDEVEAIDPEAKVEVKRFDFVVQFAWQPKTHSEREQMRAEQEGDADLVASDTDDSAERGL